ncbi:hypothetical protein [Sporomusa sphaeroides]|uniref:hypothetical protein n=1 Tax=Sporomusa sphaeroides TaxID=47679 RepID=UPI002CAE5726|nr:hypothetical protein [Sporomusa sphaeroides]HML34100.1 hypothetical protein [Sporomusa sphaeroides]
MHPRWMIVLSLLGLLLVLWPGTGSAAGPTVDTIAVTITAAEPPPDKVAKRMTASITAVGEEMLAGRTVADVRANQVNYEKLVREIFNRVLVGYSVDQAVITPGTTTRIAVVLEPWGEVVRSVSLELDNGGLSPEVMNLINRDIEQLEEQVGDVLIGLPVDSVAWAGGVSKVVIRELLANQLPEFRSNLEITAGQETHIKLSLIPSGPVVDTVQLSFRSRTIPNLLLAEAGTAVREAAGIMRGLPVAFVDRHQKYFAGVVQSAAAKQSLVSRYGITLTPVLEPGVVTEVTLNAETDKYRLTLEGNLDVGREDDTTSAKLHFGKYTGSRDEVFLEIKVIADNLEWDFEPGWGHKFTETTFAGLKYNVSDHHSTLWFNHYIGSDWMLRLEDTPKLDYYEVGVRYKLHEFLSAEYVFTEKENWLRLTANL